MSKILHKKYICFYYWVSFLKNAKINSLRSLECIVYTIMWSIYKQTSVYWKGTFLHVKINNEKYLCNNHDIELYNLINDKFF